jgi:OOP family OmpA-OmpF porin
MRARTTIMTTTAFVLALLLAAVIAGGSATVIEKRSRNELRLALEAAGHSWTRIEADGLQVIIMGTAPSEAERFRTLALAGSVIEATRIIDNTDVESTADLAPPAFSLQVLRNDDGISLIGLVPASTDRKALLAELKAVAADGQVTDMLETANYPEPAGWNTAMSFAVTTLKTLPRAKISVDPGKVAVTAITDSPAEKARIETSLARRRPSDLKLSFDISAPRPVITPFTLRFLIDAEGARFDACSADTVRARDRILAAARGVGAKGAQGCTVGMGVPSPDWAAAVEMGLKALGELGAGTITYSDADIALIAADSVSPATFDKVVGELESNLPEVFSLKAELQKKPETGTGVPEFSATLSADGQVQLRGRVSDDRQREALENFARARFGSATVYGATRVDAALPSGWPVRTMAALEALHELAEGVVSVRPDLVKIRGISGNPAASDQIARILADRLGESAQIELAVRYDKRLDPVLGLPDGPECVARLNAVLAEKKITFEPGSSTIAAEGAQPLDALAAAMKDCQDFRMELGGHTDSQGGEEMNQKLSQDRAQAVLRALRERRILVGNLTAKGYGESQPIADNDTEEGREANRRIEFVLLDEAPVETPAPVAAPAEDSATPEQAAALPEEETATEAPMGDEGPMEEAAPMEGGAEAAGDAPPADSAPAPAGDDAATEPQDAPAPTGGPAPDHTAGLPPEVAAAQDPAIEIPVAPAAEAPGRPAPRPATLGAAD